MRALALELRKCGRGVNHAGPLVGIDLKVFDEIFRASSPAQKSCAARVNRTQHFNGGFERVVHMCFKRRKPAASGSLG